MPRLKFKYCLDVALWTLMTPISFLVRFGENQYAFDNFFWYILGIGFVFKALTVYILGLHRWSWHRVGFRDMINVLMGVSVVTLLLFMVRAFLRLPSSVLVIELLLTIILLCTVRIVAKMLREKSFGLEQNQIYKRVLIVGDEGSATEIACGMLRNPKTGYIPIGIMGNGYEKDKKIYNLPYLGDIIHIAACIVSYDVEEVILSERITDKIQFRRLIEACNQAKIKCKILDGWENVALHQLALRNVGIEDLMYRKPLDLDIRQMQRYLTGKAVMVTGAGGSIGMELVRQVAQFGPAAVILVGRGENSIYEAQSELKRKFPNLNAIPIIADVRNFEKMEQVFKQYQPQVVFHAAAHKHVPLMEAHPDEAVFNNIIGTRNVAELALSYNVQQFVNISTDKAVNPTSIMGASKRIAEYVVSSAGQRSRSNQAFVSVRFGNVLGSRGSVVPIFKQQIEKRLPIQVTHPDMRRYFMTIPEAAQLVLQAAGMGKNGNVYVLDMGEPVKITDLAKDLILLAGLVPEIDIPITYTGIRPGEKLYEELLNAEEGVVSSNFQRIFVAKNKGLEEAKFNAFMEDLFDVTLKYDINGIKTVLQNMIPNFHFAPITTNFIN